MNTKEFIKLLEEVDPGGEAEVVVNNCPILWASLEAGYYDGSFYKVVSHKGRQCEIKVCSLESKLSIFYYENIYDYVFENPEVEIYYDSRYAWDSFNEGLEKMRLKGIETEMELRKELGK
ncbi:hypothetical protein N8Z24_00015 [bacterium]|nr:hypothetical protein [bacterium]